MHHNFLSKLEERVRMAHVMQVRVGHKGQLISMLLHPKYILQSAWFEFPTLITEQVVTLLPPASSLNVSIVTAFISL
jgi:hypothetical protein